MVKDEQYIELYDALGGGKAFGKGSDKQLREWGHTDESIKQLKIESVKFKLEFYKSGIEAYKKLNKICGGINAI